MDDEAAIRQRLDDIFPAWSPGRNEFSIGDIADYYVQSENMFAFDTLMPTTSVMDGWQSFADNWKQALGAMDNFNCHMADLINVHVRGDIAWSALILNVSAEVTETGETIEGSQQVSLVWVKEADGAWRIIHEHLSGPVRR